MSYEMTEEKKMEQLTAFMEKAKRDGSITDSDIKATMMELDMEGQEDNICELLEGSGVEILNLSEPDDFEMLTINLGEPHILAKFVKHFVKKVHSWSVYPLANFCSFAICRNCPI